jgi:hypothetical protein
MKFLVEDVQLGSQAKSGPGKPARRIPRAGRFTLFSKGGVRCYESYVEH